MPRNRGGFKPNLEKYGALFELERKNLVSRYLDGLVSTDFKYDQHCLQPIEFPEKSIKMRYINSFQDILNRYYVGGDIEKQVIVIVAHH